MFLSKRTLVAFGVILLLGPVTDGNDSLPDKPAWRSYEQELEKQGIPVVTNKLIELAVDSTSPELQSTAIEILGLRGETSAIETLKRVMLQDPLKRTRQDAALALARLEVAEGFEELRRFCASDDQRRFMIATYLAELGDASCLAFVLETRNSEDVSAIRGGLVAASALFSIVEEEDRLQLLELFDRALKHDLRFIRSNALSRARTVSFSGLNLPEIRVIFESFVEREKDQALKEKALDALRNWPETRDQSDDDSS